MSKDYNIRYQYINICTRMQSTCNFEGQLYKIRESLKLANGVMYVGTSLLCLFFTYYAMLQCSKF